MTTIVDLSHTIHDGFVTYPGLPAPVITDYLSRAASREKYEEGTTFHIARIEMVANTGTYLDTPNHRYADAADLETFPLEKIVNLSGIVIDARTSGRSIGPDLFDGQQISGRAVLIHTGWSRHFGTTAYGSGHPYLTEGAAQRLVDAGAALVGIDSLNVDNNADGRRPVHSRLLAANIAIVEHLTRLDRLPQSGFRFFAPAPKCSGVGSFPVRAFALLE